MALIHREQSAYVSRIPLEIFSEIFSYFEPAPEYHAAIGELIPDSNTLNNRTIKSMSLVCRHFYFHLYPLRLETMFIVNDDANQSKYKLSHCHRFCKAIVDGNARACALARYVKRCAIGCFNLHDNDAAVEKQLSICTQALSYMTSVHELHIFRTPITNELLNSILSLPPLKALRLDDCNVPRVLDKQLLRLFSTLRATHIFIRGNFSQTSDTQHATDQFLNSLCASYAKSLTCNGTTSFHLLNALVSLGPLKHLTHLHINVLHLAEYKELLSDALSKLPCLRHLHLGAILHWQTNNTIPFDLFMYPDFPELPTLEYINAHLPVLQALIPGSRVSSIGIASEKLGLEPVVYPEDTAFWDTVTAFFQMSNRPIYELDVPLRYYQRTNFVLHFPHLRRLKLRVLHLNWPLVDGYPASGSFTTKLCDTLVGEFANAWPVPPDLTYLEFVTEPLILIGSTLKDRYLTRLKAAFPSLRSLVFSCPKSHLHGRESERREYSWPESGIPSS